MTDSVLNFYDQMAEDYHLIFKDWQSAISWNGEILDRFIQTQRPHIGPLSLLDCSCGIGTQAIALALHGYNVHATDLSPASVERAAHEADTLGAKITVGVADFRTLAAQVPGTFDIVLSCDNALPHLLDDDDLDKAARNMWLKLNRGGMLLISIRDYDQLLEQRPSADPVRVFGVGENRRIIFQVWDWQDDAPIYTVNLFILRQVSGEWVTSVQTTQYRALQRTELTQILAKAGFSSIQWHLPDQSSFYQPIVTAIKS
jgi:glycine/sarcosine N-methyltransferase